MKEQWQGFKGSKWQDEVDVRDFIQNNYKPYDGKNFKNYKKKSVPKVAYWIWKQKWFQVLQLMALDI